MDADIEDVISQASSFISRCYNIDEIMGSSMTETRLKVWVRKAGKLSKSLKLCTIPPTKEAFRENTLRAHFQTHIWKCALSGKMPNVNPTFFGWERDERNATLEPKQTIPGTPYAQNEILELISLRCSCSSVLPCKSGRCSCNRNQIGCTIFCSCLGSCSNPYNKALVSDNDMNDDFFSDDLRPDFDA